MTAFYYFPEGGENKIPTLLVRNFNSRAKGYEHLSVATEKMLRVLCCFTLDREGRSSFHAVFFQAESAVIEEITCAHGRRVGDMSE